MNDEKVARAVCRLCYILGAFPIGSNKPSRPRYSWMEKVSPPLRGYAEELKFVS